MRDDHSERLVKAAEAIAIAVVHTTAAWVGINSGRTRAGDLMDAAETKLEWKLRRFEK